MRRIPAQRAVADLNNNTGAGSTTKGKTAAPNAVLQPKAGRLTGNSKRAICIYDTTTEDEDEEGEESAGGSAAPGAAAAPLGPVVSSPDQDQGSIEATPIDNGNSAGAASPKEHGLQRPGDEGAVQQDRNIEDVHERIFRRLDEMKALILTQIHGQTQVVCSTCQRRAKNFQLLSSATSGANVENTANSEVFMLANKPQISIANSMSYQQHQDVQSTTRSKDQQQPANSAPPAACERSSGMNKQVKSVVAAKQVAAGSKQPHKRPKSANRTATSTSKSTGNSRRQRSRTPDSAGAGKSAVPGVNSNAQTTVLPDPPQTVVTALDAAAAAVLAPGATAAKKRGRKKIILVKRRRPIGQKKNGATTTASDTPAEPQQAAEKQQQPQQQQQPAPIASRTASHAGNRRGKKKRSSAQASVAASAGNNSSNSAGAAAAKKNTHSSVQQLITKLQSVLVDEVTSS